jgi:ubiquinone/menaquinone biosynthesis C-methylase UbiE
MKLLQQSFISVLACPKCHETISDVGTAWVCNSCSAEYDHDFDNQYSFVIPSLYDRQSDYEFVCSLNKFWGEGWTSRLSEHGFLYEFEEDRLLEYLDAYVDEFSPVRSNRTQGLFSNEVDFDSLHGKLGVNIGCGTGIEALTLMCHGKASVIAIDITKEARTNTNRLISKMGEGIALQGDARYLPIADGSVDFVYSSGVLHHSPDIGRSVNEIYRILKPGGIAYIGLYSSRSVSFQKVIFKGLLRMKWSKEKLTNHLNAETEPAWRTGDVVNPLTQLYSKKDSDELFSRFSIVTSRYGNFHFPKWLMMLHGLERKSFLQFFGEGVYLKAIK